MEQIRRKVRRDAALSCGCRTDGKDFCVANIPLFRDLDAKQLTLIARILRHRRYKPGEFLFMEQEPLDDLLMIREGRVKIVRYVADGEERLIDVLSFGDFYGGDQLFGQSYARESGLAMDACYVCSLNTHELARLILQEPEIGLKFIQYYSESASRYRVQKEILSIRDSFQRLASFLVETSRRRGTSCVDLTQEEIGRALVLTQETVNRKLARLKRCGYIRVNGQRSLELLNPEGLRAIAFGDIRERDLRSGPKGSARGV